jgi:enamine deaminase RidA (YjgF/YER057c/UK114 family)
MRSRSGGRVISEQAEGTVERRLKELGIKLPTLKIIGKIAAVEVSGNLAFCSGHGSEDADGVLRLRGKVGAELTLDQGYQAARNCAVNLLASLRQAIGNLDRVQRVVKVTGFVNSAPEFYEQPAVMHGFTDLMIDLFGSKHARTAVGTNVLPNNQAVEVEMIVELKRIAE